MNTTLIRRIRRQLREQGDPEKAAGMRAYMKSEMPYHGVQTTPLRKICRDAFAALPIDDDDAWRATVLGLWREAKFRDERYAAIELAGAKMYAPYRTFQSLSMFEEMIVSGAWWDYVDAIASHRLRELLVRHPPGMSRRMRAWSHCDNKWKRRSSIICQLRRGPDTDLDLLWDCIEPNLSHTDFFVRKAIGWALRDLAWFDLPTVEEYVERNHDSLSPLSRREALKNAAKIRG
ncbi:MAG: DNA alkylation repair protein [Acidobacteriota bacterium]|nr:DNA alkylation repair protein [Acidobacteriota bacterium]